MKLIDQLIRIHRTRRDYTSARNYLRDLYMLELIKTMPVYVLDNVTPLLSDWETESQKPISKRPPHPYCFCEWKIRQWFSDDPRDVATWTVGAMIADAGEVGTSKRFAWGYDPNFSGRVAEFLQTAQEVYAVRTFRRYEGGGLGGGPLRFSEGDKHPIPPKTIFVDPNLHFCVQRDDGRLANLVTYFGPIAPQVVTDRSAFEVLSLFLLPLHGSTDPAEIHLSLWSPWQTFLAFALMHCKNIEVETIVPASKLQRATIRRGHVPLVAHKILKLTLPYQVKRHAAANGQDPEHHNRFHLVRGHFKNLQHERFTVKGWHWWPAHWRGDVTLGTVHKDYQLVGEQ